MNNEKLNELIGWCKFKITNLKGRWRLGEKIDFSYLCGYEDAMKAVMSKLHSEKEHSQKEQSLTEQEIFALRAVAYGCNTNKKLVCGSFLDMKTNKTMSFEDALVRVYKMLERLEGGQ